MNSDEIFDAIEEIAAISSKTGKQALIEKYGKDEIFKWVLEAALNPFKTYGLAKRPAKSIVTGLELSSTFDGDTWLVLKKLESRELAGNAAKMVVSSLLTSLTPKSAELLWRIISKDLRAGFSETTVNKAIPGLIPTFDCMLAHKFEAKRIKSWPVVAEPKLDGVRVLCFVLQGSEVKFFSR